MRLILYFSMLLAGPCLFTGLQGVFGQIKAQSVYQLSNQDAAIASLGGLLSAAGHYQAWKTDPGSPALLPSTNIPRFDRFATQYWSTPVQRVSDLSVLVGGLGCGSLLLGQKTRKEILPLMLIGAEALLLVDGCANLSKSLALRPRPFLYNANAPLAPKLKPDARFSFFSAHTAYTATFSFFTAKVLHDFYPDAKWTKWVWVAAAALPAATGVLRVRGGKHFPSDVLAGYAVGALGGILLPELHRGSRKHALGKYPVESSLRAHGAGLSFEFRF
jgi:membrane-associated phospholipid phosphatase